MNGELYWIWLSSALGAGADCSDLLSYYEWNPCIIYGTVMNGEGKIPFLTQKQKERLRRCPLSRAEEILNTVKGRGWSVVTPSDRRYPKRLLELRDMPLALYVEGNADLLDGELQVAVVGARKASDYGRAVARALSGALASRGFTIVSGGALGIDSAAHLGALDENAPTVLVMGCGLGAKYLTGNEPLRSRIRKNGALISEFEPYAKPGRDTFPLRNRIISGMTLGTVVVEAGERSGSLITARLALEQGRDVFAVPGDLVSSSFLGTNNLIRQGAVPVFSPNDVLNEYASRYAGKMKGGDIPDDEIIRRAQVFLSDKDFVTQREPVKKRNFRKEPEPARSESKTADGAKKEALDFLSENARKIYSMLSDTPEYADELMAKASLSPSETLSALTELEIYGLAEQLGGRRYKAADM